MSTLIKDMTPDDKPREKALKYGFASLSDADVLSILLRTGSKNKSVKDVSSDILKSLGGISNLKNIRVNKLTAIKGVGSVKAITLMAAVELAKRMDNEENRSIKITTSSDVFKYFNKYFLYETQEKFLVLFLNTKNEVIEQKVLFIGTANQSLVHLRDIFREAVLCNAIKIICVHNHPSGVPIPSMEDEAVTKKIKETGELMNINLIDHIIIGKDKYYSFLENRRGGLI